MGLKKPRTWFNAGLSIFGLVLLFGGGSSGKPPRCFILAPSVIPYDEGFKVYVIVVGAKNQDVSLTLQGAGDEEPVTTKRIPDERPVEYTLRLKSLPETDAEKRYYVTLKTTLPTASIKAPNPLKLLVTLRSGHVFVQLQKMKFKPGDNVAGYIYSVDDNLHRLPNRDMIIDIVNPNKTVILRPKLDQNVRKFEGRLPIDAPEGLWEVHASYGYNKAVRDVYPFEVRREAPQVFLTDVQVDKIIYPMTESLKVEVKARYPAGSNVAGLAEINLFLKDASGERPILQDRILAQDLIQGKAIFNISSLLFKNQSLWFPVVEGSHLVVKALVLDQLTGSDDVTGVASALFAKSPYVIDLSKSSPTFKPGLPYTLKGDVYDNFGVLKNDVSFKVTGQGDIKTGRSGRGIFSTDSLENTITYRVETIDDSLPRSKQAHAELTVTEFEREERVYLVLEEEVSKDSTKFDTKVRFTSRNRDQEYDFIYYMVTTKGRILSVESESLETTNMLFQMPQVTINSSTMAPGFHLTVFYINTTGTLLADSVWHKVERKCKNDVRITLDSQRLQPGGIFTMTITGPPQALVNTIIVDERQTRGQDLMITEKTLDRTLTRNIGDCNQDRGHDLGSIFYQAGTSAASSDGNVIVPSRESERCERHHSVRRYRRSTDDVSTSFDYRQMISVETITLGVNGRAIRPVTSASSTGDWYIYSTSFTDSCLCTGKPIKMRVRLPFERELRVFIPPDVHVNQQFEVEALAQKTANLEFDEEVYVAIMVEEGICSKSRPHKKSSEMPIVFKGTKGTATWPMLALTPGKHTIKVYFRFRDSTGADYPTIVKKSFIALPEGVMSQEEQVIILGTKGPSVASLPTHACFNITLNNYDENTLHQQIRITAAAPLGSSYGSTQLLIGAISEPLGLVIKDILTKGISSLIGSEPIGCGEQSMMRIGPMVFAAQYQKHLRGPELSGEQEIAVRENITAGIVYMAKFKNQDGSFSTWPKKSPSTWLTAYVSKIFAYASEFSDGVPNQPKTLKVMICESLTYITNRQRSDGAFADPLGIFFSETVAGGLEGTPAMTAYVVISLLEAKPFNPQCPSNPAIQKGIGYLKHHALNTPDVFTLSMISYALSLAGDSMTTAVLNKLMKHSNGNERRFWKLSLENLTETQRINLIRDPVLTLEIETAAYTLLALLHAKRISETHKVAAWLIYQHKLNGRFISTQDTVVALQALTLYRIKTPQGRLKMDVSLVSVQSGKKTTFKELRDGNRNVLQIHKEKIPNSNTRDFVVSMFGEGQARLEISCTYHKKMADLEECPFNLNLTQSDYFMEKQNSASECSSQMTEHDSCFKLCFSHPVGTKNMAILWFNFHHLQYANNTSIQQQVDQSPIIDHAEINPRNVIFYLTNIPKEEHCVTFVGKSRSVLPVDALPVSFKLYDYHDRDRVHCLKHYVPNPFMNNRQPVIRTVFSEVNQPYLCAEKSPPVVHDFNTTSPSKTNGLTYQQLQYKLCTDMPPWDYAYRLVFENIQEVGSSCHLFARIVINGTLKHGTHIFDSHYRLSFKIECAWNDLRTWVQQTKGDVHLVAGKEKSILQVDHSSSTISLTLDDGNIVQRLFARKNRKAAWKALDRDIRKRYRDVNKNLKKFQCAT